MLKSFMYVSWKTAPWPDDKADVEAICEVARSRNGSLGITGALISTRSQFAQILEGPAEGVDAVMNSIFRDRRHRGITVVQDEVIESRLFDGWDLAYAGPSTYVAARIAPLLGLDPTELDIRKLISLIREFAREPR